MQDVIDIIKESIKSRKRIIIQGGGRKLLKSNNDVIIGLNYTENSDILICNSNCSDLNLRNGLFITKNGIFQRIKSSDKSYLDVFDLENEFFTEFGGEFRFFPVLWMSALKLIEIAVAESGVNSRVYLSGIDLELAKIDNPSLETKRNFHLQEYLLSEIQGYYNADGRMTIIRYGFDEDYPLEDVGHIHHVSMRHLYESLLARVRTENYTIVVAEITNNHFGSFERLKKIVSLCKNAGADMIKVQKRDVLNFFSEAKLNEPYLSPFGKTFGEYRLGCELSIDDLRRLNELCLGLKIPWFASVLDNTSLEQMIELDPVLVKLPSTISRKADYLTSVNKFYKGDLVVSTGYTDDTYVRFIQETFLKGIDRNLWLLHATSSYPTPEAEAQVAVVRGYNKLSENNPSIIPGYSSHDMDDLIPMLSVSAGARMIEKHVKLGDAEWIHFDEVALDLESGRFKEFVDQIRRVTILSGNEKRRVQASENHKY